MVGELTDMHLIIKRLVSQGSWRCKGNDQVDDLLIDSIVCCEGSEKFTAVSCPCPADAWFFIVTC